MSDFTLDDDGAGGSATPNETTFTIPAAQFGSKSVTEDDVNGWSLTSLECTGTSEHDGPGEPDDLFTVGAGDTIVCTFTNAKDATVKIVKDAQPDDAQDFGFTTTGSGLSDFDARRRRCGWRRPPRTRRRSRSRRRSSAPSR